MNVLPSPLALDLKEAGWPQRRNGLHIARVHPGLPIEDAGFIAHPSATEILASLLSTGHVAEAQEALARAWIEVRTNNAKRETK